MLKAMLPEIEAECPNCHLPACGGWPSTWQEHMDAWVRGIGPQLHCERCFQVWADPWSTVPALVTAFLFGFTVGSVGVAWAVVCWLAAIGV